MKETIIVDGYNVLYAWQEMLDLVRESSLEHARMRFIEAFSNFQGFKQCKLIIVFDSHHVKNSTEKVEQYGNLDVIYSGQGQTADMVIEKLVGKLVEEGRVYVATSDYNEQRIIFGKGAFRVSAREIIRDVQNASQEAGRFIYEKNKVVNNQLGYRLKDEIAEVFEKWRREK